MVNHLEQASAFRRAIIFSVVLAVVFAMSASNIAQIAPGSLQEHSAALKTPPRALQEPFKRPSAAITQLSRNPNPFYIDFDLQNRPQNWPQNETGDFVKFNFPPRRQHDFSWFWDAQNASKVDPEKKNKNSLNDVGAWLTVHHSIVSNGIVYC